jgi:hypothetical protein
LNRDGLLAAADAFSQIGSPASVFAVAAAFHAFQMDSTESSSLRERLDSLVPPALASEGQWAHSDEAASLVSEVRELAAR